jgi:hypothetical protein
MPRGHETDRVGSSVPPAERKAEEPHGIEGRAKENGAMAKDNVEDSTSGRGRRQSAASGKMVPEDRRAAGKGTPAAGVEYFYATGALLRILSRFP